MNSASKPLPAGLKGDWLMGNADDLKNDPLGFLLKWHKEHGDCVPMRTGTLQVLLLCNPDLMHEVFVTKASKFSKDMAIKNNPEFFGQGLLRSEGDYWKRQRKLASPSFSPKRIELYSQDMIDLVEDKLKTWQDGQIVDIQKEMMQVTLSIASKTLFDAQVDNREEFEQALTDAQKYLTERLDDFIILLLPEWVPFPTNVHLHEALQKTDKVVYQLIKERRGNTEGRHDLLSSLIEVKDDDGSGLSDEQIRDEVFTFFFAGHETTALTLSWTLYLLSQHPEVEAKLLAEINEVLADRRPGVADAHRLSYTNQVIMESMRVRPPVWAIAREAIEACEIGGYEIPKGTSILMSQWVNNHDERWFKDPDKFMPERWTREFSESLPKFAFFPFGGGPRTCIGNNFALLESILLLAEIIRAYHLILLPDTKVELQPAVTLRPRHGIKMKLEKRK